MITFHLKSTGNVNFSYAIQSIDGTKIVKAKSSVTVFNNNEQTISNKFTPLISNISGDSMNLIIYLDNMDLNTSFYIETIKIEKGNKATDWSPSGVGLRNGIENNNGDLSIVDIRLKSAEQKITAESIISTVTSSDSYINNNNSLLNRIDTQTTQITQLSNSLSLKATQQSMDAATGNISNMQSELAIHANEIATKVDVNGVKSTIEQTPTSVSIGFNAINSDVSVTSADGLKISHSDGSYTKMSSGGLERFVSSTGHTYHYLTYVGTAIIPDSQNFISIQLPNEFKNKNFSVIAQAASLQNLTEGFALKTYEVVTDTYDYANATFHIAGTCIATQISNVSNSPKIDFQVTYMAIA
jgi:hypothetical protein